MSAKKKLSQLELRKYMKEHKSKEKLVAAPKRIESPLAKYNDQGQLICALCKSVVRSEAVWTVHINAKLHKTNVELAKKLKERTKNFTTPLKRPLTPPHDFPTKKLKSILKNGIDVEETSNNEIEEKSLPSDFFDKSEDKSNNNSKDDLSKTQKEDDVPLPEGFFDDPKLDAKARNQEYKDPIQEEWEKFQKEMREVEGESAFIIAEDQEEATTERQIDEIDEQMKNLSKVLDLEKKRTEILSNLPNDTNENMDDEDEDDDMFDEFLDWRSKNSTK